MFLKKDKIEPLGKRILVQIQSRDEFTSGGIFIASEAQSKKLVYGKVVKIPADEDMHPLKIGFSVLFNPHLAISIDTPNCIDKALFLVPVENVLAILR